MKIIVASKNPVKVNAIQMAFKKVFPESVFEVQGISVPSDVNDQPLSEEETLLGATNRSNNAKKAVSYADFWVGIEGGLEEVSNGMETFAWVVVTSKEGSVGRGRTGSFFLPDDVVKLIKQGLELGEADDIVFNRNNSKQDIGSVGILTGELITRTTYYEAAIIFALIPFKNEELY